MNYPLVVWKPIETALTIAAKKSPAKFQTFLNRTSSALGQTIPAHSWKTALKNALAKGGPKAKLIVGSAASGAALTNVDDIKNALLAGEPDAALMDKQLTETAADASAPVVGEPTIDEILGDDTPGSIRNVPIDLVDTALKTVEESLEYASVIVRFTGSSKAARALVAALNKVDIQDFDIYDRMRKWA